MTRIRVGDYAPDFYILSANVGSVSLSDYIGKQVVIIFGRYFGCPVCQLDFDDLLEYKDKIKEYAELVYFSQSSPDSIQLYIQDFEVDFPIISVSKENNYKIYREYGVGNMGINTIIETIKRARIARKRGKIHGAYEGRETQSPADFVINEKGKIIWVHTGPLNVEKLLSFLESI